MTELTSIERALVAIAEELGRRRKRFAIVGGLAVSVRAEVRFTRDVDVAVAVADDQEAERIVLDLQAAGYRPVALVEHDVRLRLATARLLSPLGVKVDLLFASSGIETEVVEQATPVRFIGFGSVPVASAEDLIALKVLSMTDRRLQDKIDAQRLLATNPALDLERVRARLSLIAQRGFHRDQDLVAKLEELLRVVGSNPAKSHDSEKN